MKKKTLRELFKDEIPQSPKDRRMYGDEIPALGYTIAVFNTRFKAMSVYRDNKENIDDGGLAIVIGTTLTPIVKEIDAFIYDKGKYIYVKKEDFDAYWKNIKENIAEGISQSAKRQGRIPEDFLDLRLLNKGRWEAKLKEDGIEFIIPQTPQQKVHDILSIDKSKKDKKPIDKIKIVPVPEHEVSKATSDLSDPHAEDDEDPDVEALLKALDNEDGRLTVPTLEGPEKDRVEAIKQADIKRREELKYKNRLNRLKKGANKAEKSETPSAGETDSKETEKNEEAEITTKGVIGNTGATSSATPAVAQKEDAPEQKAVIKKKEPNPLADKDNIYFVISNGKFCHDRDCKHILQEDISHIKGYHEWPAGITHKGYPSLLGYCKACRDKLLLREACGNDWPTYNVCRRLFSTIDCTEPLENLITEDKATFNIVSPGILEVIKGDDTFRIKFRNGTPIGLFHNNYKRHPDGSRTITKDKFHEQHHPYLDIPNMARYLQYIGWYSYEDWHGEEIDETADDVPREDRIENRGEQTLKRIRQRTVGDTPTVNIDRLLALGKKLEIWRVGTNKYAVWYPDMEIKEMKNMPPVYGQGETIEDACEEYIRTLQGTTLLFKGDEQKVKVL